MTDTTDTRRDFEAWADTLDLDVIRFNDGYSDCNTDYAWSAWQAAATIKDADIKKLRNDSLVAATTAFASALQYFPDQLPDDCQEIATWLAAKELPLPPDGTDDGLEYLFIHIIRSAIRQGGTS